MSYDHERHRELVGAIRLARARADRFKLPRPLRSGDVIELPYLDEMIQAYDELYSAVNALREYLNQYIGNDGRIYG